MAEEIINFELPVNQSSIIKVIGVGGGGGNAINHMFRQGIKDVNFVVCNTDAQDLTKSPVAIKIQLGKNLTEGRGAGSKPEVGRNAAMESLDDINRILEANTRMVFITAGMGGGTGTGAAPVIAKAAREKGLLTVAIVTIPFRFEGEKRITQAIDGINELKEHVDSLLIVNNEKIREMYGNLKYSEAFAKADNVLTAAAKGIAEIITVPGYVNVDFADVQTVMTNSGMAIMGSGVAEGENRALRSIQEALTSPLLNNNDFTGAKSVLLNINYGQEEVTMDEIADITEYINRSMARDAQLIWGAGLDENLGKKLSITVIATGFHANSMPELSTKRKPVERIPLPDFTRKSTATASAFEVREKPQPNVSSQRVIEFDIKQNSQAFYLNDENTQIPSELDFQSDNRASSERMTEVKRNYARFKELGFTNDDKGNIDELENEPAYMRRNVKIAEPLTEPDLKVSRFTLGEDEETGDIKLRPDNAYLHDNVD
jgi:cell division protein FtsZ